jgi:hypothetical protein
MFDTNTYLLLSIPATFLAIILLLVVNRAFREVRAKHMRYRQIFDDVVYDTSTSELVDKYRVINNNYELYTTKQGRWFISLRRLDCLKMRPISAEQAYQDLASRARVEIICKYFPDKLQS